MIEGLESWQNDIYFGYGDKNGPDQGKIYDEINGYNYLKKNFPKLSYLDYCKIDTKNNNYNNYDYGDGYGNHKNQNGNNNNNGNEGQQWEYHNFNVFGQTSGFIIWWLCIILCFTAFVFLWRKKRNSIMRWLRNLTKTKVSPVKKRLQKKDYSSML